MFELLYSAAAKVVIATLLTWIGVNDPHRTEPLTWPEVLSNVDHMADDGNRAAMEMIVLDYFQDRPTEAVGLIGCENPNWDPRAVSATHDFGTTQLNRVHWGPGGLGEGLDPFHVRDNVTVARWLYDGGGWGPWTCRWAAR